MIPKTECDIHKGQQLTAICIDQYCSNNTACCQICIENLHNVHDQKVVTLSSIQNFISNKEIIEKQNHEYYLMKKEFIAIRLLISELAELVDEKIQFLSKNQLQHNLTIESLFGENPHQLHILKVYLQQYHIKNNMIANLNDELKQKMEYQLKQQVASINDLAIEYTKKIRKQLQKLSIDQFKEELKYSETNKHKYIQIKECKNAVLTQQIGYGVIYGEQGFDPSKESFHCSFLINNLSYGLVGFGQIDASKRMNYQIYDFSLGHGFYVLHNTGTIYNSDDSNNNNVKQKALAFDKHDIVVCQYEAQTKQFTFFKESNRNEKHIMQLTNTKTQLYPVSILFGPGDSISFL